MHGRRWFFRFERSDRNDSGDEQCSNRENREDNKEENNEVIDFHEIIWNHYFVEALLYGITREEFKHLNPKKLEPYREAYKIKKDEEDARNWQLGIYFANSIMSTLMNSSLFRDLSSPQNKYPEKPLFSSYSDEDDLEENSEANEILAAMEMDEYIKVLKQQNS